MRIIAVTQARAASSRLPEKVLKTIKDNSLLEFHIQRIKKSTKIDLLIVATTVNPEDKVIVEIARECGVESYCGSANDVLDRFYHAREGRHPDYVVRLTSDCPLIDPVLIDKVIQKATTEDLDYCSNTLDPKYPDGQDVEVFKYDALERAWKEAVLPSEREHVTPYIWKHSSYRGGSLFKSDNFMEVYEYGHIRMTVDEQEDFRVISHLIETLGPDRSWLEYAQFLEKSPTLAQLNKVIPRNEGYSRSVSNDKRQE